MSFDSSKNYDIFAVCNIGIYTFIEAFWAAEFRFGELSMPYSGARNRGERIGGVPHSKLFV